MEKQTSFVKRNKSVFVAVGVTLAVLAAVVIFAVTRANSPTPGQEVQFVIGTYTPDPGVTRDPAATPTRAPETLMFQMIGDWRQTGADPTGIVELHLHGDNTAVYVRRDVFDPEPHAVSTRWQAQEGLFSMIVESSEVVQYSLTLDGDTLTLTGSYGETLVFERYSVTTGSDL
jgi:hypothetical protein